MKSLIRKVISHDIEMSPGERAVIGKVSGVEPDREGDVLIPRGCYTKDYERNPVVLFNHDSAKMPIGTASDIRRTDDGVYAKTTFAKRPDSLPEGEEWLPDTIYEMFKQGVLRAFSVGFMPTEMRPPSKKDREVWGDAVTRVYSKWSLLEFSVVTIGMHQDALVTAVSKGLITEAGARAVVGDMKLIVPRSVRRTLVLV